jgi:hypothetical protein
MNRSETDQDQDRGFQTAKEPRMCHERSETVTRRAALALLPWLGLTIAGAGCSPAGQASSGAAGIPDRLEKMRALRGTGDPRRPAKRPFLAAREKSRTG